MIRLCVYGPSSMQTGELMAKQASTTASVFLSRAVDIDKVTPIAVFSYCHTIPLGLDEKNNEYIPSNPRLYKCCSQPYHAPRLLQQEEDQNYFRISRASDDDPDEPTL